MVTSYHHISLMRVQCNKQTHHYYHVAFMICLYLFAEVSIHHPCRYDHADYTLGLWSQSVSCSTAISLALYRQHITYTFNLWHQNLRFADPYWDVHFSLASPFTDCTSCRQFWFITNSNVISLKERLHHV